MKRTMIDPQLEAELRGLAESAGCELVHVEFQAGVLRLFLDRPDGISLRDCEQVARQASALLDVAEFAAGRYTLEVSSPGLDRQLYRPSDYERFSGRRAKVTFTSPDTGRKRTVTGRLVSYEPEVEGGTVRLTEDETQSELSIPLSRIQVARLEIEI